MNQKVKAKEYDLEDRTLSFALNVRKFVRSLPKSMVVWEDGKQLIRASGSIGANYIEANESLGKKDFLMRIRICRKEAKESRYWLDVLDTSYDKAKTKEKESLIREAYELMYIFAAIMHNSQ